jgi:hypothetical protein
MFRVLKWDRWLSIVFAHKDVAFWDAIMKAAQDAGFEYVNTVVQPSKTPSLHKRKNPLKVLSGELVLNFRKVRSPRAVAITTVGQDVAKLIQNTAELAIVQHNGASTEDIYNQLIPVLLENGLLAEVWKSSPDITGLLAAEFDFSEADQCWHIRPNTRLGSFVPLAQRIRFYLLDFLNRASREGRDVTFDDIIFGVMPNLINGKQPTDQSILEVLSQIAESYNGNYWRLRSGGAALGQIGWTFEAVHAIPVLPPIEGDVPHDDVIYRLGKLARSAGLDVHVGMKEQSSHVHGERLGDLSTKHIPAKFAEQEWTRAKVQQIDFLAFDGSRVVAAVEVEASTPITTGIDRFLELLKVDPNAAGRLVIVIPRKRQKALDRILRNSHYVGHPMYMENKLGWLMYEDLLRIYDRFAGKAPPSRTVFEARLLSAVKRPDLA